MRLGAGPEGSNTDFKALKEHPWFSERIRDGD